MNNTPVNPAPAPQAVDHNLVNIRPNEAMDGASNDPNAQMQQPTTQYQNHPAQPNAQAPVYNQVQTTYPSQVQPQQNNGIVNENLYNQGNVPNKYYEQIGNQNQSIVPNPNPVIPQPGQHVQPTQPVQYTQPVQSEQNIQPGQPDQNVGIINALSNDLRSNELLTGINDVNELASKYIETASKIPKAPEKAEDYKWDAPNGLQLNQEIDSRFRDFAIKNGYSQEQYESLNNFVLNEYEGITATLDQQANENKFMNDKMQAQNALKEEWGSQYDHKMNKVLYALEKELGPDGRNMIENTEIGTNPAMIKMIAKLSDFITEDSYHAGGHSQNLGAVHEKFDTVFGAMDSQNAYWDERHPNHAQAVIDMEAHFQRKHNGQSDFNSGFTMGSRGNNNAPQQTFYK